MLLMSGSLKSQHYKINVNKNYKQQITEQLKKSSINFSKIVDNYNLEDIYVFSTFCIKDTAIKNMVFENIISFTSFGSLYHVNNKELVLHTIKDAFNFNNPTTKDSNNYFQYKNYVKNIIKVNDSVMVVGFNLVDKKLQNNFYINELIVFNDKGIVFDNFLYFINPMVFKKR